MHTNVCLLGQASSVNLTLGCLYSMSPVKYCVCEDCSGIHPCGANGYATTNATTCVCFCMCLHVEWPAKYHCMWQICSAFPHTLLCLSIWCIWLMQLVYCQSSVVWSYDVVEHVLQGLPKHVPANVPLFPLLRLLNCHNTSGWDQPLLEYPTGLCSSFAGGGRGVDEKNVPTAL